MKSHYLITPGVSWAGKICKTKALKKETRFFLLEKKNSEYNAIKPFKKIVKSMAPESGV